MGSRYACLRCTASSVPGTSRLQNLRSQCHAHRYNLRSACQRGNVLYTAYSPSEDRRNRPDVRWLPMSGSSLRWHSQHLRYKGFPVRISATRLSLRCSSAQRPDYRNPRYLQDRHRSQNLDIQNLCFLQELRFFPLSFPYQYPLSLQAFCRSVDHSSANCHFYLVTITLVPEPVFIKCPSWTSQPPSASSKSASVWTIPSPCKTTAKEPVAKAAS